MITKKLIIFTLSTSIIFVLFFSMALTDYNLSKANAPPRFAMKTAIAKDGGTTYYKGFGYKVIDYNQMEGRKDVVFIPFYENMN